MDHLKTNPAPRLLRLPPIAWGLVALSLVLLGLAFPHGIAESASGIWNQPEYSHGLIIPFITLFLIWQRREELERLPFTGSWAGVAMLAAGIAINLMGVLGSLFIVQQYAVVIALYGLVLALTGWRVFRLLWVPLLLLLFMIPLPDFLYQNLSAQLQLISSKIGVAVIRFFGISVFLEGNVIDLGVYKLQVAEACSGLRYLFPLMTLGFIMAYIFHAAFWKRALLFLSSIPITILMNSVRIGFIGILVDRYGIRQAEGFLHDFEGWVIFMASTAVMVLEIVMLANIGRDRRPWREVFGLDFPPPVSPGAVKVRRPIPAAFITAVVAVGLAAAAIVFVPPRSPAVPARMAFVDFPAEVDGLSAQRLSLERIFLDQLKLSDYLYADYRAAGRTPINFYIAWYDTQEAGRSAHSPRSCLPAGGWVIENRNTVTVPGVELAGQPVRVNRVTIRLGNAHVLVYYFFKQRDRLLTSEYAVKWYLMWDALTRNRTDGALVRLTIPVNDKESMAVADAALQAFLVGAARNLPPFLPD